MAAMYKKGAEAVQTLVEGLERDKLNQRHEIGLSGACPWEARFLPLGRSRCRPHLGVEIFVPLQDPGLACW